MDSSRRHIDRCRGEIISSWLVLLLFAVSIVIGCIKHLKPSLEGFQSWGISDWLINYEGGFVRRGLLGQLLIELEKIHLYDVRIAITLICVVFSLVILFILLQVFKKQGWSLLIIPTGLCLGFIFMNYWGRRDMLSLTMTFVIFYIYKMAVSRPRGWLPWGTFHLLSVLQILIHEASFFYTFPILMLHNFYRLRSQHHTVGASTGWCLLHFMPVLMTMGLVCLFKGDQQMAESVWASWAAVFNTYQPKASAEIGLSVKALGWDAMETFYNHFYTGYIGCHAPRLWRIPLALLNLPITYLLVTRLNSVKTGIYPQRAMNHTAMSDIVLVQFFALLPMYTVLSCDWGRTLPYLVISSVFFFHLFNQERPLFSRRLSRVSARLQDGISAIKPKHLAIAYILLVLLAPIPRYYAPLDTTNTFQQRFQVELLRLINH